MYKEDKTFTHFNLVWISLSVLFTVLSVFFPQPLEASRQPINLSIEQVIERVRTHNLQMLIGEQSVRRALERSYKKRADLLPRFSLSIDQTQRKLSRGLFSNVIDVPAFNSSSSRLEASLSLINYQIYADYRIAQLNYSIAQNDFLKLTEDYTEQALFLYFTHLRDLRNAELAEENLKREQALVELATLQFEAGVAIKIDLARAEVRAASARRELMDAEIAVRSSGIELKSLLDIDLERDINLDSKSLQSLNPPLALKSLNSLERIRDKRPEISIQLLLIEQAKLAKRASFWKSLPTVDFFADWGYDTDELFNGERGEAWFFGLQASMPIWEGGRIAADKRYASATLRQKEYEMRKLLNQIDSEYKISIAEMDFRYEQIAIARDEARLGGYEVELALERYQEGLADNRELIDAQNRLAQAERSRLNARYMYSLSLLKFARVTGSFQNITE